MGRAENDWAEQEAAFFGVEDVAEVSVDRKLPATAPKAAPRDGERTRYPPNTLRAHAGGSLNREATNPATPRVSTVRTSPPLAGTTTTTMVSSPSQPLVPGSSVSFARRTTDGLPPGLSRLGSAAARLSSRAFGGGAAASSAVLPYRGCVVCGTPSPSRYIFNPFFPEERACASHTEDGAGAGASERCFSCRRFSPLPGHTRRPPFADLGDRGRRICGACLRTVVTDSTEGSELWMGALEYFRRDLSLFDLRSTGGGGKGVEERMEAIPVLIVDMDALNDPSVRGSGHGQDMYRGGYGGGGQSGGAECSHTRGLCLFEYKYDPLGGQLRDFLQGMSCDATAAAVLESLGGGVATAVARVSSNPTTESHVTAVLCLRGLPRDLAASVLAHEATHAWFKIHPEYDATRGLPKMVEEGCCQLVAFQYLHYLDTVHGSGDWVDEEGISDDEPSDRKLRQYFRFCIETMTDSVYGEGFRRAAASMAFLGSVRAVLEYVVENSEFPPLS